MTGTNFTKSIFVRRPSGRWVHSGARLVAAVLLGSTAVAGDLSAADIVISTDQTSTVASNTAGDSITVQNGVSINTSALSFANGIEATGGITTITNNGMVTTNSDFTNGILVINDSNTIVSNGNISTTGFAADAIIMGGNSNTIINSGALAVSLDGSKGIFISGSSNAVTNSGSITTNGGLGPGNPARLSEGILVEGDFNSVANAGLVTTNGFFASGIFVKGDSNFVISTGSVAVNGIDAFGMVVAGNRNTLINSGNIITNTKSLAASGSQNKITNSGTINNIGSFDPAVQLFAGGNTFINSGTVTTIRIRAIAVDAAGGSNVITNSGTIISLMSDAIRFAGSNNVLNILPGSQIQGEVDLGEGTTINIVLSPAAGQAQSVTMSGQFDGVSGTLDAVNVVGGANGSSGAPFALVGNMIAVADPSGIAAGDATAGSAPFSVHALLDRRLSRSFRSAGGDAQLGEVASLDPTGSLLADGKEPTAGRLSAWAGFFGGRTLRDAQAPVLEFRHEYGGGAIGIERSFSPRVRAGVVVGAAHGRIETMPDSVEVESDTVFAGLYGRVGTDDLFGVLSLLVGHENRNSKRLVFSNVSGQQTARADYSSLFVSPSASLGMKLPVGERLSLRPSTTLSYTASIEDGYTETGSSSNLGVDDRLVRAVRSRIEVAAVRDFDGDKGSSELRVGLQARFTNADDVDGTLAGIPLTFTPGGDKKVSGGFVGAGVSYALNDTLRAFADFEGSRSEGHEVSITGQAGFRLRF